MKPVIGIILAISAFPTCVLSEDKLPSIQYEYAVLTQLEFVKERNEHNQPSLQWRAPEGRFKVTGKNRYEQLLNELGQKTDPANKYDLYDLLNHLGSKGWDLCTAFPTPRESESQLNQRTQYVFKKVK